MGTFRGVICNNDNDYRQKERLINDLLTTKQGYTSEFFAGGRGVPDLWSVDDKPILIEPKKQDWADLMPTLPLNFTDLDTSIIKRDE